MHHFDCVIHPGAVGSQTRKSSQLSPGCKTSMLAKQEGSSAKVPGPWKTKEMPRIVSGREPVLVTWTRARVGRKPVGSTGTAPKETGLGEIVIGPANAVAGSTSASAAKRIASLTDTRLTGPNGAFNAPFV